MKRWTKAVDLFLYDIILVPLHLGVHWAMAVSQNAENSDYICSSFLPVSYSSLNLVILVQCLKKNEMFCC